VRFGAWRRFGHRARTPLDAPIAILLFMACVGSAISVDWSLTQPKLFGLVFGLAAFWGTRQSLSLIEPVGTTIGAVLLALQGVAIALLGLLGTQWTVGRLPVLNAVYARLPRLISEVQGSSSTTSGLHPAELGGILLILWPCVVAPLLWPTGSRSWLNVVSAMAGVTTFVLILTASRSVYVGMATALLLLLRLRAPRMAIAVTVISALAAAGVVLVFGPTRVLVQLTGGGPAIAHGTVTSLQGRIELWSRALLMLQDFPFTGVGLNVFPIALERLYPTVLIGTDWRVPHAHNFLLQTGVDFGIPGLLALVWILALAWRCWIRAWNAQGIDKPPATGVRLLDLVGRSITVRAALAGTLAGITGHLVYGLTDAVTLGAKPGYLLWMALAVVVAASSALPWGRGANVKSVPTTRLEG
jgi:putative inorganic carbon (HCO3(-)) transporter